MELHPGSKRKEVGELLSQLLSRDAVEFNSCINAYFSSNVAYTGHGLKFEGASRLKHASWLFNALITGPPASFDLKDIEWNEQSNSATVHSVRYVRPKFFPFIGFAVPVETHLRFHADGAVAGPNASQTKLYVTKFEDLWTTDQLTKSLPIFGAVFHTLITPIVTFLWLTLSSIAFYTYSHLTSSKRQYVDPSVNKIEKSLPKDVAKNVNTGFNQGTKLAQGWTDSLLHLANRVSYPILYPIEHIAQQGVSALPVPLPFPYIYDAHSHPPTRPARKFAELQEKKASASSEVPNASARDAKKALEQQATNGSGEEKKAAVQVMPSIDGQDQGKVVGVTQRTNNESKDIPAPALKPKVGESLYDQLRKDGELPSAEDTERLTKMTQSQALAGNSSEDEESTPHHGNGAGSNGAPKKKKSGGKKKRGGISHAAPPSFKEGLHQAEEHDAHH